MTKISKTLIRERMTIEAELDFSRFLEKEFLIMHPELTLMELSLIFHKYLGRCLDSALKGERK